MSALVLFTATTLAEAPTHSDKTAPLGTAQWLDEAKFGMFIHWGVYSELARGEWVMNREKISVDKYSQLAKDFNPVKFNAEQWVAIAKNAGMKYITITAKHHDGFAIYDSAVDDYNIVDGTPFKRDALKELQIASEKAGIKLGFYYSQTQDWYHKGGAGRKWDRAQHGDFRQYLETVSFPQIKELLTYNPTHLWFDTPHSMTADIGREIVDMVRKIKPDTLVNSRLMYHGNQVQKLKPAQLTELTDIGVDFLSYRDRTIPPNSPWDYWETCMTLNNSWGYRASDNEWKSSKKVVMQLAEVVSKGGSFLLNVGPTSEGVIPQPAVETLARVGDWLKINGEAIYGAEKSTLVGESYVPNTSAKQQALLEKEALATGAGKKSKKHAEKAYNWIATERLATNTQPAKTYIHVFEWPEKKFEVSGITKKINKVYLLSDKTKTLSFSQKGDVLNVVLPNKVPDSIADVLTLEYLSFKSIF
ncbi:MAG: alpha-L-fucosidase [Thalassotalea sp.]